MNYDAFFSDGSSSYVIPTEPKPGDNIRIRFRAALYDVDEVWFVTDHKRYPMRICSQNDDFSYYEIRCELGEQILSYTFQVIKGDHAVYYNRYGVSDEVIDMYQFKIAPGFSTPDWAKGALMYQILVDRFHNGDPSNDVLTGEYIYIGEPCQQVTDWNELPQPMDVRRFHGGDLQGVLDKLDYLEDLGVEVIYFNPLFVSPSNHKYDTQDYDYIDPHYGVILHDDGEVLPEEIHDNSQATKYQSRIGDVRNLHASNMLFAKLVQEMHKRGMRVILDGVFNHCGSFNKWLDRERIYEGIEGYEKGAYVDANSDYRSFFKFHLEEDEHWPYNNSYEGWWGHDTLPKLNFESSAYLRRYIKYIGRKWISAPYNVDGWRLDVAADLGHSREYNHKFWKEFREEIKKERSDVLILAEHYGDPSDWLQGDQWDSVMNYDAFMEPISWFLTGMEKHSEEFRPDLLGNAEAFVKTIMHFMSSMMMPSLLVSMNQLSNHDHSRFLTRTNHLVGRVDHHGHAAAGYNLNYAIMREAVVFQMTWIGAPTLYYGDEVGVVGFTDPDNRRTFPWGHEDQELLQFHKDIIHMRKEIPMLRDGSVKFLDYHGRGFSYARFQDGEAVVVALNNSDHRNTMKIPVWLAEVPKECKMERLFYTYENGYTTLKDTYFVHDGELVVNMGAYSAIVLHYKSSNTSSNHSSIKTIVL